MLNPKFRQAYAIAMSIPHRTTPESKRAKGKDVTKITEDIARLRAEIAAERMIDGNV